VTRFCGYSKPALRSAARMRSLASRTAPSGDRPWSCAGGPSETSTSTSTTIASMPRRAPERTRESIGSACRGRSAGAMAGAEYRRAAAAKPAIVRVCGALPPVHEVLR
jgi:hypothetical protein